MKKENLKRFLETKKAISILAFILVLSVIGTVISAEDISGTSGTTNNTQTITFPNAPTNLSLYTALTYTSTYIPIIWTDNSSNEDKFKVEKRISGETNFSEIAQVNGTSGVIAGYPDYNVTPGVHYDYRVRACFMEYCSDYATLSGVYIPFLETNTNTSSGSGSGTSGGTSSSTLLAPSGLMVYPALTTSSTGISLKWTDNSTNEEKFKIERRISGTSTFTQLSDVNANIIYFYDSSGVSPGVHYDYRVRACAGSTCSDYALLEGVFIPIPSTTTSGTNFVSTNNTGDNTSSIPTATRPLSPTNFSLYTIPTSNFSYIPLKWVDNSNNEEKFKIERKLSSATVFYTVAEKGPNTTSHNDSSSINPGVRYDYRIRACAGDLCSEYAYLAEVFIPLPPSSSTSTGTNSVEGDDTEDQEESSSSESSGTSSSLEGNSGPSNKETSIEEPQEDGAKQELSREEIKKVTDIISSNEKIDILNEEISDEEKEELFHKDSNNDGISDYDSVYVYKMDPIAPSPTSTYEGKIVNAGEKISLGFDPVKPELVKVIPEEVRESEAPTVSLYKVKQVQTTDKKEIIIKGQALPNSFVTIYIYSTPIMVTIKTNEKGEWQYKLDKELEDGSHAVYVATVNNTGNIVAKSSPYVFIKTAEAATLLENPAVENTSEGKPGFLKGRNAIMTMLITVAVIALVLILIGLSNPKKDNFNP